MSVKETRQETRKEIAFKWQKKFAEVNGEPFPYKNYDEWKADAPKREEERKRYWSQKHVWLEDIWVKADDCYYYFINPETGREIKVNLSLETFDTYWDIIFSDGKKSTDLSPLLNGPYNFEQLGAAKIDIVNILKRLYPNVTGWNDDFKYNPEEIRKITIEDNLYPSDLYSLLKIIDSIDIAQVLFTLGDARLLRKPLLGQQRIAIIGSRKPDSQGIEVAYRLGKYFSNDIVVSGLAKGIDTAAHLGCLDGGGKTIAVVGSGLNYVYPKENAALQKLIIETGGLILSEQESKVRANPRRLIARTRLQMALADKVYVVECERESGTMHAVNFALKYGKPIFALDCNWSGNRYLLDNGLANPL